MRRCLRSSGHRVRALTTLRLRRLWRTRTALLAAVLALLPVMAAAPATPRAALVVTTGALLTAVLVCTAGALADDLESGAALLLVLHDAQPFERVLAEASATLLVIAALALLAIPMHADAVPSAGWRALSLAACWIALLVLAWTFLVVLLGCVLPGKGNGLVMIVPLAAFALPAAALPLGDAPAWLAAAVRFTWSLLPLQAHATAIVDALLANTSLPATAPVVLLVSPPLYLAAAVRALARVETARRFTQ